MNVNRDALFVAGQRHIMHWCDLNEITRPTIWTGIGRHGDFGVCAYYRDDVIHIWPDACAHIGTAARAWSYPGYVVDRTPYGVLAHELAHHVEHAHGAAGGVVAQTWRRETADTPLTSYCDNDNEWFAEIFRLYVTNPDLLSRLRPKMFARLADRWPKRAEKRIWTDVLGDAPRQLKAAENHILKVFRHPIPRPRRAPLPLER